MSGHKKIHRLSWRVFNFGPLSLGVGMFLTKLASLMLIPALVAVIADESGGREFFWSAGVTYGVGMLLLFFGRRWPHDRFRLGVRDMFLLTTGVWLVVTAFAALPFVLVEHISYTDAYFETMSGITTTGSTILSGLDDQPWSILLWRSMLHWIGGIGFIVVGVAILPFLNVGGMRLFQTESSDWSDKTVAKTRYLALHLLLLYLALSVACTLAYSFNGMGVFDAINHAMSTVSTGGFSTSDQSMAHFSPGNHWIAIVFMILSSLPFPLLILALRQHSMVRIWQDQQVRGLFKVLGMATLLLMLWLWLTGQQGLLDALRIAAFNVVSIVSTTGFGLGDFTEWGAFAMVLVLILMAIGGCSGSTAGGVKIFRYQITFTLLRKQLMQQIHPASVTQQSYNGRQVKGDIIRSIVTFFVMFQVTIACIALILALNGVDFLTSVGCAISAVGNVGPGLTADTGPSGNFAQLPVIAKWAMSIGMLMGRLEILTVIVLFYPRFWRI